MNILITGASGMVGKALQKELAKMGIKVLTLSSGNKKIENSFRWNTEKGIIDPLPIENINGVIHLAGAGIADKPWTAERKNEILNSRVKASQFLYEAFEKGGRFPEFYISASGVGYYPQDNEESFDENAPLGSNFLSEICEDWEKAAELFKQKSKLYILRFGVIFGENGFLKEILKPARFFAGAVLGDGKQVVPWIHLDDVVSIILNAVEGKIKPDTYNIVAPSENNLDEITRKAAKLISRPVILPNIPAFMVKLLFGERSLMLLGSQKIKPVNLVQQNYAFKYPELDAALKSLLK